MFDGALQDVRYAVRLLGRNPLFALTASLSLAIGIGANTTILTIANALLFKPPAGVVEPNRLVDVGRSQDGQGFDNGSYPNYLDIRSRNTVFSGIYAYRLGAEPMSLGGRDGAERIDRSLGEDLRPFVYVPLQQQYLSRVGIMARSTHGQRLAGDLRKLLASMNPNLPIVSSQTLDEYASLGLVPQRVAASISASLGIVGLLLAAIGIYGVTAYMVTSRTREIGIRIALGAQRGDVVRMVLGHGMALAAGGVTIGLILAAGASRLLGSLLFGIGPMDPLAFAGSAIPFCLMGLTACYVPARRATEIEATEALRYE